METTKALVWMLRAPSASGGKIYVTLVIEDHVMYAWGREDKGLGGLQYKYQHFSSPAAAQQGALLKTQDKEKRAYAMAIPPKVHTFTDLAPRQVLALLRGGSPMARQGLVSDAMHSGVAV